MSHKARLRVCVALLGLATLAAATADPKPTLVSAQASLRQITLTGFTRARAVLPLVTENRGRIEEVLADIGDAIGADGLFARLDDTFIRLELEQVLVEQQKLRGHIEYDQREVERYRELARQKNASASQLDTLEQTLRDNRHQLQSLEIQQKILEERLSRTRIRAPAGWRLTQRRVEPGQWVNEGTTVGEAADFSTLLVPFALTPRQFTALENARGKARLSLPDLPLEVAAELHRSNPSFDPDTRKIAVELRIVDQLPQNRGGLRTRLALQLPERSGAVMLPAAAVRQSYEEFWVTREDGETVEVVLLGNGSGQNGDLLRIASPLIKPGDRFLVESAE